MAKSDKQSGCFSVAEAPPVNDDSTPSVSVAITPYHRGRRYWAKVIRAGEPLPFPREVQRAVDLPGEFLCRGQEELLPGDFLFEGEANHHSRTDRGWSYWISYINAEGKLVRLGPAFGTFKAAAKAQGLDRQLLTGSGPLAGAVRVAHALRSGLTLPICGQGGSES